MEFALTTSDDVLARDLAVAAGELLLTLRAGGGDPDSLRRAGDRQSHEFLMAELSRLRPADAVLSEEGKDDAARLSAGRVWIVDPLDGTREFGEPGRTDWAVHVALWEAGELTAGAVALPAQGKVLSTADPIPPASVPDGPLRLLVSRSRPPEFVQRLAERL
jgi:3'(2'), 5'-bisphosphate nucleotidase